MATAANSWWGLQSTSYVFSRLKRNHFFYLPLSATHEQIRTLKFKNIKKIALTN